MSATAPTQEMSSQELLFLIADMAAAGSPIFRQAPPTEPSQGMTKQQLLYLIASST